MNIFRLNRVLTYTSLGLTFVILTGCGNLNSVYRKFNVDDGGAMVDIKQRAVLSSTRGHGNDKRTIVCAEPSPDSMSAYAAQLAAEGTAADKVSGSLAAGAQESAAFVGLRTTSIQLLRDSMYRLCEAHMSGALDSGQYGIMMRRYQKYMVALLGIEQLTGAIRVPTVTINTQTAAAAAQSLSEYRRQIEATETKISDLDAQISAEADATKKASLVAERDQLKLDKGILESGVANLQGMVASGSTRSEVSSVGLQTQRSDAHVAAVTGAIKEIVLGVTGQSDDGQLCFEVLSNASGTVEEISAPTQSLISYCEQYLIKNIERLSVQLESAKVAVNTAKGEPTPQNIQNAQQSLRVLDPNFGIHSAM